MEVLSKKGGARIALEMVLGFFLITLVYMFVLEPLLLSVAPGVYVRAGLDYSRTDLPSTASEITHLLLLVASMGSYLAWRLNYTELGQTFSNAFDQE